MDLFGFDPPELTTDAVATIAHDCYGIEGSQQRLRGERSHNTLITTPGGTRVVLKVASSGDPTDTIQFHAAALEHLERVAPDLPVARMVPALDGSLVPVVDHDGKTHAVRLVTYLPGVTFADGQIVSPSGLRAIGRLVGSLSVALASFTHAAARRRMPWDIANGLVLDAELWSMLDDDARTVLEPARERLDRALDIMQGLPRQIIHNDAHAGNLLRSDLDSDVVTGVIDFGDLVETVTVADLGVSAANLAPHQADPAEALAELVAGFHSVRPLDPIEVAAVPELVLARLALSLLFTDYQIRCAPHISAAVGAERHSVITGAERWLAFDGDRLGQAIERALA